MRSGPDGVARSSGMNNTLADDCMLRTRPLTVSGRNPEHKTAGLLRRRSWWKIPRPRSAGDQAGERRYQLQQLLGALRILAYCPGVQPPADFIEVDEQNVRPAVKEAQTAAAGHVRRLVHHLPDRWRRRRTGRRTTTTGMICWGDQIIFHKLFPYAYSSRH